MDCCFSSICPNDLINNVQVNTNHNNKTNNTHFNQVQQNQYQIIQPVYTTANTNQQINNYDQQSSNEQYSTNSSSCSSSPSLESNQYFDQNKPTANTIQLSLDSLNTYQQQPQCISINSLDNSGNFQTLYGTNVNFSTAQAIGDNSNKIGYFRINSDEPSLSPSSSISSSSLSTSSASSTNGDAINQFQAHSKKIQKLCDIQPQPQQQQSIIVLEPQQQQQTVAYKNKIPPTTVSSSHKISRKSANILPPSPPSSFGSDSESNQSSSSSTNQTSTTTTNTKSLTGLKANKLLKSNKLLRANGGSLAKQMRQNAYSFKQAQIKSAKAVAKVTIKTESSCLDTSNSLLNLSTNSDDDCWPFLCSLSKLPSSGPIMLTEEEKRTLVQEGHQVPSQLPLTKSEEKVLKKIRRKIKNKISAQESRRKKKEYVDSLEKRMESYINENVELKKRLESLEINNKGLLQQLQKMKSSIESPSAEAVKLLDFNEADSSQNKDVLNIQSANQFGTLLMVLVLFFTVLLGVWSPMITKDHMSQASATAAAAASISVRSATRSPAGTFSYSAASATTTAAVAAASLAIVSSVAAVKSESLSPQAVDQDDMQISCFNSRPVIMNDDEDDFLADDLILTGQINNNVLTTRSRAGNTIELTKVRPFVRKLPIAQSQPQDFVIVNNQEVQQEAQQVIFLNVSNSNQITSTKISEVQPTSGSDSSLSVKQCPTSTQQTNITNIPVSSNGLQQLVSKPLNPSLISLGSASVNSGSGYRVINTVQNNTANSNAQKLSAVGPKLPTRFRLINNGINTFNSHHMAPSVIKLNTLA